MVATISAYRDVLSPVLRKWDSIDDPELMPRKLAKRLRSLNAQVESISPKADELSRMVDEIINAHSAAESLPTDLEMLKEANNEIKNLLKSSQSNETVLTGLLRDTQKEANTKIKEINEKHIEAAKLIRHIDDLYRIGTSTALAGAFKQKAETLQKSVNFWLFILIAALVATGIIGSTRMEKITEILSSSQVNWQAVLASA